MLVEVVTPDEVFFKGDTEMIIVRTTKGDRGILKNHRPLVAVLSDGNLRIKQNGKFKEANISGGFMNVNKDKTVIITEKAIWKG